MSTHANRVKMTVTSVASSGTGDITLNAASTGFRSFATAYSNANATVDILITEGTAWEIARNCTYTHSGTTVSRGTLESSSTGSAVVFTSAAVVSVIATAAFGNNAALNHVAGGDADTTMAVGNMYVTDMSAWATADRTYTLPAAAAVGDRIGIMVTAGDASHELIIKPNTGDKINGGTAAAEWSRLFITGEVVILRCVVADSEWVVEYDGRIPCYARIQPTATQALTNGSFTSITLGTVIANVGGLTGTANTITIRRVGEYAVYGGGAVTPSGTSTPLSTIIFSVYKAGAEFLRILRTVTDNTSALGTTGGGGAVRPSALEAGDALTLYCFVNGANLQTEYIAGVSVVFLSVQEQL